jgi:hypothetical protein
MWRTILFKLAASGLGLLAAVLIDPNAALGLRPRSHEHVVVLRSRSDGDVFGLPCGEDRCRVLDVEDGVCGRGTARVVVVTGHSVPPHHYLNRSAADLARALACLQPEVIVLDTCYGFSAPLLRLLAALGSTAEVVGPMTKLPPTGLRYDAAFFAPEAPLADRIAAVSTRSGAPLQRWRIDAAALATAFAEMQRWTPEQIAGHVARRHPDLLWVPLGAGQVLMPPQNGRRL